jgi:hypothetical protein
VLTGGGVIYAVDEAAKTEEKGLFFVAFFGSALCRRRLRAQVGGVKGRRTMFMAAWRVFFCPYYYVERSSPNALLWCVV